MASHPRKIRRECMPACAARGFTTRLITVLRGPRLHRIIGKRRC
jgi:hypothetical protein